MRKIIGILTVVIALSSCNTEDIYYEEYMAIPDNQWSANHSPYFEFEITDTLQRFDLSFNFRHTSAYEWENIWVFADIQFPNEMIDRDTLEFLLQDGTGKWLGTGSGDLLDGSYLFRHEVRFPFIGKYKLSFHQAMRTDILEDVSDVGLKIKKSK